MTLWLWGTPWFTWRNVVVCLGTTSLIKYRANQRWWTILLAVNASPMQNPFASLPSVFYEFLQFVLNLKYSDAPQMAEYDTHSGMNGAFCSYCYDVCVVPIFLLFWFLLSMWMIFEKENNFGFVEPRFPPRSLQRMPEFLHYQFFASHLQDPFIEVNLPQMRSKVISCHRTRILQWMGRLIPVRRCPIKYIQWTEQ